MIGWTPLAGMRAHSQSQQQYSLVWTDISLLKEMFLNDWWLKIFPKICEQEGLNDASGISVSHTLFLRKVTKCNAPTVGCVTSNALLFSAARKHFVGQGQVMCPYCQAWDSQQHRMLECPHFQPLRESLPNDFLSSLTRPALLRGLWVIPPECAKLQEALEALPPPAHNVFFEEHICLFTDGSTYDSTGVPRSAWSVVCTREGSLDNAIVESACLCGKQSNPRAELTAVLVAFQHAVTADIYSDALGVVRGVRRLLREGWRYKYWGKQVNLDLWWLVWQQIFSKPGPWKIFHVKSHSDHRMAVDQFSKWTFWHNAAADEAAKAAHLKRSVELNQCFEQASAAAASQRHAAAKLFAFHEGVVKQAGGDENPQVLSVGGLGFGVGGDGQIDLIRDLGGVQVQTCVQPLLEFDDCLMGPRFLWVLQKFFLSQSWKQTQSPVSVLEIYLEFVAQTGWIAPANTAKMESATLLLRYRNSIPSSWVHESEYPALKLCRPALGKQVTVFLHAIKELFKRTQAEHSVVQEKALSVIGLSRRVPALYICPMTIDAQAIRLKSVIGSDKYDLVVKRPYSPPANVFQSCPLPVVDPQVVWNLYCQRHRQRRR